jgi:BirA family biotin operon repressor/biotin-[acetyl-CoA-carboxylase] ligase
VLVDGRKAAGILIETAGQAETLAAIIGCGVNLAHHPDDTRWPATHVAAHRRPVDPSDMMTLLAACMETRLEQWDRGAGQASIIEDWTGTGVRPWHPPAAERRHRGRGFRGLASSGAMLVQLADGTEHLHHAGDVEWSEALAGMT